MRRRSAAACLAIAGTLLSACVSEVRFAPRTQDWTVSGDEATWRAGDVEISASLAAADGRYPIRGEIRCRSRAEVAFVPEVSSEGGDFGEVRDPAAADARPSPVVASEFVSASPAATAGASAIAFSLRPDVRWTRQPAVGSTVSYSIVVRTAAGEVRCPFYFRVDVSETRVTTLGAVGIGAGVVVVFAALTIGATGYYVATSF